MISTKKVLKNLFSLSLAEVANKGISFITTAYLARVLHVEGLGIIGVSAAWFVLFTHFVNLGLNTVGMREVASPDSDKKKLVDNVTTARLILSIISYGTIILFSSFLDKPFTFKLAIWIACLGLFSTSFSLDWFYQGLEKMGVIAIRQVAIGIMNLVGVILLVHNQNDVNISILINFLATFINSIWMFILYVKSFEKFSFSLDKELLLKLSRSGILMTISFLFIYILNLSSTFLLGIFRTETEAGIYTAAYKTVSMLIIPSSIIQNTFFPILSRAKTIEERIKVMSKYTKLMYLVGTVIMLTFFSFVTPSVNFIWGDKYLNAIPILLILLFSTYLAYINTSLYPALLSWRYEKVAMYITAISAVLNLIFNLIMIPRYGVYAAAWSAIISEVSMTIFLQFRIYKVLHKIYIFEIIKIFIIGAFSSFIGFLIYKTGIFFVIPALISIIIYFVVVFLFKIVTINEIKGYFAK